MSSVQGRFLDSIYAFEQAQGKPSTTRQPVETSRNFKNHTVKVLNYASDFKVTLCDGTDQNYWLELDYNGDGYKRGSRFVIPKQLLPNLDSIVVTRASVTQKISNSKLTAQVYFKDGDTCYPTKLTHTQDYISSHQQMKTQATLQLGEIEKKETFTYNRENFLKAVRSFQSFPIYGSVLWEHLESERSYATNPSISHADSIELINCVDDRLIAALTTTPKLKLYLEITDKNNPKNHIKVEIDSQLIPNPQGVVIAEYREKPAIPTRRINEKTVQIYIASQGICFAMKLKMEFDEINQQEFETSKIFLGRLPIPPHAAKLKNTVLVFEKDLQDNNAILFKTDNNDLLLVIKPSEENGLLKSQVYRRDLYGNWIKYRIDYGNNVIDFTSFEINMMTSQKLLKLKNSKESIGLTKIEADLESIGVKTTEAVRSLDIDYSKATLYSVGSMKPMYLLYVGETNLSTR